METGWKRRRALLAIVAVLVCILFLAAGGWYYTRPRAPLPVRDIDMKDAVFSATFLNERCFVVGMSSGVRLFYLNGSAFSAAPEQPAHFADSVHLLGQDNVLAVGCYDSVDFWLIAPEDEGRPAEGRDANLAGGLLDRLKHGKYSIALSSEKLIGGVTGAERTVGDVAADRRAGRLFVSTTDDFRCYDLTVWPPKLLWIVPVATERGAGRLAVSHDGNVLASGGEGVLRFWDAKTGAPMWSAKELGGGVWDLAFSPADDAIAVGGEFDPPIQVFPFSQQGPLAGKSLVGHKAGEAVCALSFSPDGRLLASGSSDGSVIFWNATDYSIAKAIPCVNGQQVNVLAFSPSGFLLATAGGYDGHLKLWAVP